MSVADPLYLIGIAGNLQNLGAPIPTPFWKSLADNIFKSCMAKDRAISYEER